MKQIRSFAATIVLAGAALLNPAPAAAQSFGVGGGLAGIENHDPVTGAVAVHLQAPMAGRLSLVAAYAHWFGDDGNAGFPGLSTFYGDDGLSLVAMYDVVAAPSVSWGVGAGLAQYEVVTAFENEEDSDFIGAVALSTLLTIRIGAGVDGFVRGEIAAPTTEIQPRWSYLVAGLAIGL